MPKIIWGFLHLKYKNNNNSNKNLMLILCCNTYCKILNSFVVFFFKQSESTISQQLLNLNLPVGPLMWLTKMTSSLSCSDSGEEFESLSMSSESVSEPSLILIMPPISTQCFGNLGGRPLGFPTRSKIDIFPLTFSYMSRHNKQTEAEYSVL